mmetsp:Transcript_16087/g.34870  ORF Transcript_16087/g.34870 Transcript_16087/m.34870 type:complete len:117 (+) Transcript_16087:222-572(+)
MGKTTITRMSIANTFLPSRFGRTNDGRRFQVTLRTQATSSSRSRKLWQTALSCGLPTMTTGGRQTTPCRTPATNAIQAGNTRIYSRCHYYQDQLFNNTDVWTIERGEVRAGDRERE